MYTSFVQCTFHSLKGIKIIKSQTYFQATNFSKKVLKNTLILSNVIKKILDHKTRKNIFQTSPDIPK